MAFRSPDSHLNVILLPLVGTAKDLVGLQDLSEPLLSPLLPVHVRMMLLGKLIEAVLDLLLLRGRLDAEDVVEVSRSMGGHESLMEAED